MSDLRPRNPLNRLLSYFGDWTLLDSILSVLIISVGIICTVLGGISSTNSEVQRDTKRLPLSQLLLFGSFLASILILISIKLKTRELFFLIFSLSLCLCPIIILIILLSTSSLTFDAGAALGFVSAIAILSFILRYLKRPLKTDFPIVGYILSSAFCILVPLIMITVPLYMIITTQNLSHNDILSIFIIESFGLVGLAMIPWVYCHFRQFHIKDAISELAILADSSEDRRGKCNKILTLGPSITVLGIICVCVITSSIMMNFELESGYSEPLVVYGMLFLLTPTFVYLGMVISRAEVSAEVKIYIFTLLFGVLPLCITIPLYIYYQQYRYFSKYLAVLPPFAMLIWAFLSLISHTRLLYNILLSLICLTIAFPIGFIYPLTYSSIIPPVAGYIILSVLCLIPIALFFVFIYWVIQKFRGLERKDKIKSIKSINFYYPTWYIIMLCFVFGEASLIYFYCQGSENQYSSGGLMGMICLLPFVFSSTSVTMQNGLSLSTLISRKVKIQLISAIALLVLIPIFVILIYTAETLGSTFIGSIKSLAIGLSLLAIITNLFILITQKLKGIFNEPDSINPTIPLNLTLWLLLVTPVCIIFPISLSKSTNSQTSNKYIGLLIIYLGIVFMIIVSVLSIAYNIYKNKMDEEKLARKCCKKIFDQMFTNKILSNEKIIRQIYIQYEFYNFSSDYSDNLNNKQSFRWDKSEDSSYFKEIVTKETYDQRRKREQEQAEILEREKIKEETERLMKKKAPGFWLFLRCFEDYPRDIVSKPQVLKQSNHAVEALHAIEVNELEPLADEDFEAIRPPLVNHSLNKLLNEKLPETSKDPQPNSSEFQVPIPTGVLRNLINDRSARKDWLKSVFNFIASEANELSSEPWLSETVFFQFCRSGGIAESVLTDAELRLVYARITTYNGIRAVTQEIFVNELIPTIGKMIFKYEDKLNQEIRLVSQVLFPNITMNAKRMMNYPNIVNSRRQIDSLQRRFTRTMTMKSRTAKRPSIGSISEMSLINRPQTEPLSDLNILNLDPSAFTIKDEDTYENSFLQKWFESLGKFITGLGLRISEGVINKLAQIYKPSSELVIDEEPDDKPDKPDEKQEKDSKLEIKKWGDACNLIIDTINSEREKDRKKKEAKEPLGISFTFSNLSAFVFKVVEILQLAALGFKTNAMWVFLDNSSPETQTAMDTANSDPNNNVIIIFWVVFGVVIIYFLLALSSREELEKGRASIGDQGLKLKWYSFKAFKKRAIGIFGGGMYMFIIKYQMNIFACDYELDPPTIPKSTIECYTEYHIGLMTASFIGLMLYYPIATSINPLLQFSDIDLDLKLQQTYLIVLAQAKLLISGIKVFLSYNTYYEYQLIIVSLILLAVLIYTVKIKPSKEWRFNLWSCYGYYIAFITNLMAYINVQFNGSIVITFTYAGLAAMGLILTIFIHLNKKRKLTQQNKQNEPHGTKIVPEPVIEEHENIGNKAALDDTIVRNDNDSKEIIINSI